MEQLMDNGLLYVLINHHIIRVVDGVQDAERRLSFGQGPITTPGHVRD
jgi:hypothetical protein